MDSRGLDGLFTKNVPHVLEKIFFFLDYESYKTCLEVSNAWNDLLSSESFRTRGKSVFHAEIFKDVKNLCTYAKKGEKDKAQDLLSSGMLDVNVVVGYSKVYVIRGLQRYGGPGYYVQLQTGGRISIVLSCTIWTQRHCPTPP